MRLRVLLAVVLGVLLCSPRSLQSQDDAAARLLNLTSDSKSLPLWTKPKPQAGQDLAKQVKVLYPGVFIIGHPKGGFGTGFVVSQEHRLIATNAHVADIRHKAGLLLAIGNDSTQVFKVEKVWYHPGVIRDADGIKLRSQDPSSGDVYAQCPDVALLRVGGKEKLPPALPLATPKELKSLFAQPVGMLGFPGHDTIGWPGIGEEPRATYRQGVIARATDFDNDANADTADLQFLQHTMANWFGFSGSPIFLTNGHVAAINNSARKAEKGGLTTTLAFGIRIDSLRELVGYHHLEDKLPLPVPVADLRLARFKGKDLGIEKYFRVWDMVGKSRMLMMQQKWVEAQKLLDEAIKIAPNFAEVYRAKAEWHSDYAVHSVDQLTDRALIKQTELAVEYSKKALLLKPGNIDYMLVSISTIANLQQVQNLVRFGNPKDLPEVRAAAQRVLGLAGLHPEVKAHAHHVLGMSFASYRDILIEESKAIKICPYRAVYYHDRAELYDSFRRRREAAADRAKADLLDKGYVLYGQAVLEQDLAKAIRLLQEACRLTNNGYYLYVSELAEAHFDNEDYAEAVRWNEKAWKLVESWPNCDDKSRIARNRVDFREAAAEK